MKSGQNSVEMQSEQRPNLGLERRVESRELTSETTYLYDRTRGTK